MQLTSVVDLELGQRAASKAAGISQDHCGVAAGQLAYHLRTNLSGGAYVVDVAHLQAQDSTTSNACVIIHTQYDVFSAIQRNHSKLMKCRVVTPNESQS